MPIRLLPKEVVDKIAAGEVIERPASVVKELIENTLDAGATHVTVEVEEGGARSIKVTDDGHGIAQDDLELAFASHATSKLGAAEDLLHIGSFGFRGEALASIGSISRARIRSLARGAASGAQIECDGGRLQPMRAIGVPPGTTVEVRDLFFNVPARRRFLRTRATELAHITEVVMRFSLSQPQVAFTLRHDGKDVFQAPAAQSLAERIAHAHGARFAQSLVHKEARAEGLRLEAFLAPPDQARPRSPTQVLFVNGRLVRDRAVAGAARRAYAEVLPHGLQPTYFLFLDVDPAQVDVNVHPTKAEVRFRDGGQVFRLVLNAITEALHQADLAPRVAFAGGAAKAPSTPMRFTGESTGASLVRESARAPLPLQRALPWASAAARPEPREPSTTAKARPLRYLQIHRTYLALEVDEGLLVIDQHALHERVIYQRLRRALGAGRLETQRFLVPEVVEVDPAHLLALEEAQGLIERLGVELRPVGERAVALSAAPAILSPVRAESLVHAIATRLLDERPDGRDDDFLDRTLFTMACHRAVRAGDELEAEEIEALLREADLEEHTHTCPHGRPTRIVVTLAELENLFKRRGF